VDSRAGEDSPAAVLRWGSLEFLPGREDPRLRLLLLHPDEEIPTKRKTDL